MYNEIITMIQMAQLISKRITNNGTRNSDRLRTARHMLVQRAANIMEIAVPNADGGPGSGNWGHAGRPGKIGGSASGGGVHNRMEAEGGGYTSFSKLKKSMAEEHVPTQQEIDYAKKLGGSAPKQGSPLSSEEKKALFRFTGDNKAISEAEARHIETAIAKANPLDDQYEYSRGFALTKQQLDDLIEKEMYAPGRLTSWTPDESVAAGFAEEGTAWDDSKYPVVVKYRGTKQLDKGMEVSQYSQHPEEDEAVFSSAIRMRVGKGEITGYDPEDDYGPSGIVYINLYDDLNNDSRLDGGPGSGNWGHAGRPGKIGGSASGGGVHNRMEAEGGGYTSFSKLKKSMAEEHVPTQQEIDYAKKPGTIIKLKSMDYKYDPSDGLFHRYSKQGIETGTVSAEKIGALFQKSNKSAKVLLADEGSPNYQKVKNSKQPTAEEGRRRFDNAFRASSREEADEHLRANAETAWAGASDQEKQAIYSYTGATYGNINSMLRGEVKKNPYLAKEISNITAMIDRSKLSEDIVFSRGVMSWALEKTFGLNEGDFDTIDPKSLIGKKGTDKGFMSTGSSPDTGFYKEVNYEILAPKGTKAVYCEPFSAHGNGKGMNWDSKHDGKEKQEYFSNEQETLFQRGTSLMILDAERVGGNMKVKAMVIGQNPESI